VEFDLRVRGPCDGLPVKAGRAWPENAFHRFEHLQALNPQAVQGKTCWESLARAPIRLLPIRAPRQAGLRTSSGLAPSIPTRPCDPTAWKTRDAFDRFLPPKRTASTGTSCVPGSRSPLSRRGRPSESKAPNGRPGESSVSRRPRPLRRIAMQHGPHSLPCGRRMGVGVFVPRR